MKPNDLKTFPQGGVHPADNKLSAGKPIAELAVPETVSIPVAQHIGAPASVLVQPNDRVKAGQLIAQSAGFISANVHSSVSGTVLKIDDIIDTTGYKQKAVVIKVDGDEWMDGIDRSPDLKTEIAASDDDIRKKVADAGIVGLGGAAFPSHVKLSVPEGKTAEYLTVNGVECEPYLTADHRLMLEKSGAILVGVRIILKALNLKKAMIGIEANKQDAIDLLTQKAKDYPEIEIHPLAMHYPQGGERQLVKALTGREIPPPPRGLPIDAGCVVFNVGTVFAIYEAVQKNKPLVERVVTMTGKSIKNPSNYKVRIGTPVSALVDAAGGLPDDTGKILSGGPMMGKSLFSLEVPITKGMSGILIMPKTESHRKEVLNCIRCAKCVSVCPLGLEPYLLMAVSERGLWDQAETEKITNCCECACCSFICPSNRPLLDYIRLGKATVGKIIRARQKK